MDKIALLRDQFKALSDPSRLKIVMSLMDAGELCVCDIVDSVGLSGSTVSRHIQILHHSGIVKQRKEGRWIHLSLDSEQFPDILIKLIQSAMQKGSH